MKGLIISCVLMLLVVVLMITSWVAIENAGKKMCKKTEEIKTFVKEEDWEKALTATKALQKEWEKDVKWLTMLIDHSETDEIAKELYALEEYIIYEETPELMATASMLYGLFEHIPKKERPSPENII